MPRGFGTVSKEPDKDGFYVARISVQTREPDGTVKPKRIARYSRTRSGAEAKLVQLRAEYGVGASALAERPPTTGEYLESWIARRERRVAPKTAAAYRLAIGNLAPYIGHVRLDLLTSKHVEAAILAIERDVVARKVAREREIAARDAAVVKRRRKPPDRIVRDYDGARTAQSAYDTLRAALNGARREGLIAGSPLLSDTRPKAEREIDYLTRDEARAFLEQVADTWNRALWHVLIAIGLRWSEAAGLRWRDVSLADGYLTVTKQLGGAERTLRKTKTLGSRRRIDLPPSIVRELEAHRDRLRAHGIAAEYVFVGRTGRPLHASNVERREFAPALERAGVRRIRIHDLRHTCATIRLLGGANPKVVSELLGHTSIRTTLDLYAHALPTLGREDAKRYDETMFGP